MAGITVAALVVVGGVVGLVIGLSGKDKSKDTVTAAGTPTPGASATPSATPSAAVKTTACNGPTEKLAPATRTFKAEPKLTIDTKASYTMTLVTSCGTIKIPLDAAKAPHTVNMLSFLAADKFYDGSRCHRSVTSASLTVLQCGDPTGTGAGQIGFTIAEENLKGATYPRGTLAMAKTSAPHSTGSQFFLVDKDSQLPPDYTVAGHISTGLDVLDKLTTVGDDNSNGTGDGAPNKNIYLESVTVTKS